MRYLYRCPDCGFERERQLPMTESIPEEWDKSWPAPGVTGAEAVALEPHAAPFGYHTPPESQWQPSFDGMAQRAICFSPLRRVYETPGTSLGPQNAKYSTNDGYIDQNKYYGADYTAKHNHFH